MTGRGGAMFVIVGFAALLLIIAVFSGFQGASRLTSTSEDTNEVEEAARAFVQALGTFDFREPQSYRERLLGLTTGAVRQATLASGIDPAAVGHQRTTSTDVVSVSVTALSGNRASASATAEQLRRSIDPQTRDLVEERVTQRLACRLERQGNAWLVAEFRLISEEPLSPTP